MEVWFIHSFKKITIAEKLVPAQVLHVELMIEALKQTEFNVIQLIWAAVNLISCCKEKYFPDLAHCFNPCRIFKWKRKLSTTCCLYETDILTLNQCSSVNVEGKPATSAPPNTRPSWFSSKKMRWRSTSQRALRACLWCVVFVRLLCLQTDPALTFSLLSEGVEANSWLKGAPSS